MVRRLKRCFVAGTVLLVLSLLNLFQNVTEERFDEYPCDFRNHKDNSFTNDVLCKREVVTRSSGDHEIENILKQGPFVFDKRLQNPCFYQLVQYKHFNIVVRVDRQLRCVPYFFIIGFPKCGTTDLWNRLTIHPDVVASHYKESYYLDDKRFSKKWSFHSYLDYFLDTSKEIESKCGAINATEISNCRFITGEATANTAAVNDKWHLLTENKGYSEPKYTNPDYLHHINPNMKLIVLVRDPVQRLWSDYLYLARYFNYNTSQESFHINALAAVKLYQDCLKYFSPRGCAYNESIDFIQMRLRMGLYDIYLADWFKVFPRKQVLVIRSEEYQKNISETVHSVLMFLGLEIPSGEIDDKMSSSFLGNVNNKTVHMYNETFHILTKFYKPSMDKLSKMLNYLVT